MRVTITVPADLAPAIERAQRARRLSRSALITDAIRRQLAADGERAKVDAWVAGYRRKPQSQDELEFVDCQEWELSGWPDEA